MSGRANRRASSRSRMNRLILAGLVLLALGAIYGIAGVGGQVRLSQAAPAAGPASLPVTSALLACPAPGTGSLTGGSVAVASNSTATGAGQAVLTELSPGGGTGAGSVAGTAVHILTQPSQLDISRIPQASKLPKSLTSVQQMAGGLVPTSQASGGLLIQAAGTMAQGLDAEQLSPAGEPTARCLAPGADFWFLAPSSSKLHLQIYLLNTDSQAADADVGVQTDAGPPTGTPDSGIVVPPYSMVTQDLSKLLSTAHATSLHVTTSTGRVVAAVRETSDTTSAGAWLPVAQTPSVSQILPGLPGTTGVPELYLTVPGNQAAQVQVTAIGQQGTFQPTGGNGISLLSHMTTGVPLPSLSGITGAVKVTSNVPVGAVIVMPGGPSGAPGAFISGAGPVTGQAVLAGSPVGGNGSTKLVLSAPDGAASVTVVRTFPGKGLAGQSSQTFRIPARSSREFIFQLGKHDPQSATAMTIVVTPQPGSGPVYAGRVALVSGSLDGVLALISTPTSVSLPDVRESLIEVLG